MWPPCEVDWDECENDFAFWRCETCGSVCDERGCTKDVKHEIMIRK